MKNNHKYLSAIALNGMLCLFLALPASAQRPGSGSSSSSSSGGGGSHTSSSGGGGGSSSSSRPSSSGSSNSGSSYRPSSSGNSNSYKPSSNNSGSYRPTVSTGNSPAGGYRPSISTQRVAVAPPRIFSQGIRPPSNRIGFNGATGTTATTTGNRGYVAPGTGNVVGTRGYVGQGGRGSVGVGGRGYYPTGYFGAHHYYYYYRGYYGTYYAPRLGFALGILPYGYYSFYWNDLDFYYCDGLFYNYSSGEYTVVEPPVGAEVDKLPSNAQSIVINGQQYYEADGVYYEPITKDDGTVVYQVAGKDGELNTGEQGSDAQAPPQVGDVVTALPENCRKININGEKYWVAPDGYYFQEAKDQNGNKVYKVVGTPSDEPENQQ